MAPARRTRLTVSRRKWAAPRVRLRRIGPTLAQSCHQHVAGARGDGEQRVIAPLASVVVALGSLLGQPVSLADGGIKVDVPTIERH